MIYAIVPLESDKDVEKRVKSIDKDAYVGHAPHVYFVSYTGSSSELVNSLGFKSKVENSMAGIVLRVGVFNGYADGEMWEWLYKRQDDLV